MCSTKSPDCGGSDPGQEILSILPQAILKLDGDGLIFEATGNAESLLSLSIGQIVGTPLGALPHFGSMLGTVFARAKERGGAYAAYDLRFGAIGRGYDVFFAPTRSQTWVLVLHVRGGQELTVPQGHGAAIKPFTTALAHEVRNPLAGIKGAAQLLGRSLPADKQPLAQLIEREVERVSALITRFESMTLMPEGQPVAVNVHQVIDHVRALCNHDTSFDADISIEYDPSLPDILAVEDSLAQILLNLLRNAGEAQGGVSVRISTSYNSEMRYVGLDGTESALPVQVTISDNGPGVPEALRQTIFEPFITSKEGGEGLGLALAALYMDHMGGAIRLLPSDEGASFALNFRRAVS